MEGERRGGSEVMEGVCGERWREEGRDVVDGGKGEKEEVEEEKEEKEEGEEEELDRIGDCVCEC